MNALPTDAREIEPGIYFGLPETTYHQIEALSSSGIKNIRISTLDFWARSWLNPDREHNDDDTDAKSDGRAYHSRLVEGKAAFEQAYVQDIDPADHKGCLRTVEDLKQAIEAHNEHTDVRIKTTGKKDELIERLLSVQPTARIWEAICDDYAKQHEGKAFLPAWLIHKIELAAAMVERKPDLKDDFKDGMPEVSVVYRCLDTDVLCKFRTDYLKPRQITDLKSFSNLQQRPIADAINREFANRRMALQAAWYLDGAKFIPALVKAGRVFGEVDRSFLQKLVADHDRVFKFVFIQKGIAPVARGKIFKPSLDFYQMAKAKNEAAKMLFRQCLETFSDGAPWVDVVPTDDFVDEEIPLHATD